MLEFAVPASVSGLTTVKLWGSTDVPTGHEDDLVGTTLNFWLYVGANNLSVETVSMLPALPSLAAAYTTIPNFYGELEIDAGEDSGQSLYVMYASYDAFGAPGATTTVFQVTMSNRESPIRPNIGFKDSGTKGRFL